MADLKRCTIIGHRAMTKHRQSGDARNIVNKRRTGDLTAHRTNAHTTIKEQQMKPNMKIEMEKAYEELKRLELNC